MQAFVTVADLRGFAPAARKLRLSPSAVTRLIAALEERLGARLLQRTTRSVTLTDAGTRYLERVRRILADVEEAEGAAEGERTRPSGRLVVSAPVGLWTPACQPGGGGLSASAIRTSRPNCGWRTAWSISSRTASISRSGSASSPIPRWWRAMSARCGASWWPRPPISSSTASRRRRREIAGHQTIQFGATASASGEWRFVEGGREFRLDVTPRFSSNSADAAIQYAEQGGGLTRVLAYQAADGIRRGAAEDRAAEVRAARAADPHRLSDVAAAVGQGARVHRSRHRDRGLAFRRQLSMAAVRLKPA